MTWTRFERDLADTNLNERRRRRIAETLGSAPRDALKALVDYGLSDHEIARYYRLPRKVVIALREHWGLPPNV